MLQINKFRTSKLFILFEKLSATVRIFCNESFQYLLGFSENLNVFKLRHPLKINNN
jgi:hypothetical protein